MLERFKRFEKKTEIDVAGEVVALVGPNEAGKSSILNAMLFLDNGEPFTPRERTRDTQGISQIKAGYVLDDDDRLALEDLPGGRNVRWWTYGKRTVDNQHGHFFELHPSPQRDLGPRLERAERLLKLADAEQLTARFHDAGGVQIADAYANALAALSSTEDSLSGAELAAVRHFANTMFLFSNVCAEPIPGSTDQFLSPEFCELLGELREYDEGISPHASAGRRLIDRRPEFLMFTSEDRDLRTTYELPQVIDDLPLALFNLAQLAQLDVHQLLDSVINNNAGRRETLLVRANARLAEIFRESWGQEELTVRLALKGAVLEILVSIPGGGFNEIQERSAGLRSFVALRAFLAQRDATVLPILLVDEAEMHLHYDAQADLIDLFTEQHLAAKVIYTTHSAGCLPRDLGSGIRVVVPISGCERSTVKKSVWEGREAGFTPLIFGMGATTFAFLPARNVLLTEGITDAILLPTIFREATNRGTLPFQVAPGLSSAGSSRMFGLNAEGGSVLYLTDGDAGGRKCRTLLKKAGIAVTHVFGLDEEYGEDLHLEDLIDSEQYAVCGQRCFA